MSNSMTWTPHVQEQEIARLPGLVPETSLLLQKDGGALNFENEAPEPSNEPPEADFDYSPSSPIVGDSIDFTDQSSDSDGSISSWSWSFGDGSTSEESDPTHSYESTGDYTVTLTVTDDAGATDEISKTVNVSEEKEDGGGLPLIWIAAGIGIIIAIVGILSAKK